MRITLRQVEAFFWTAKLGSVRAAAAHLNYSQPAVSARIRELEEALNIELFTRRHQKVQLTAGGRDAVAYAERALSAGKEFERLGRGESALEGVLRLGSDELTAMVSLPEILRQLKRQHPKLIVEITIDVGAVLQEKLRKREIDIALHTNAGVASHVIDELLGWVDFQWIAGGLTELPDCPLTPDAAIKLTIVTNSPPSTLNSIVRHWLRSGGFEFDGVNSCNSLWLMMRLVQEGYAIAVLPTPILADLLPTRIVRVLSAEPVIPPVAYYASHLADGVGRDTTSVVEIARSVLTAARFFMRMPNQS